MYKTLIACRAGMGSSLMLKIKTEQVIKENSLPITVEHSSLDGLAGFTGELVLTLSDVAEELNKTPNPQYQVIGINNIIDKNEILLKLNGFLESK